MLGQTYLVKTEQSAGNREQLPTELSSFADLGLDERTCKVAKHLNWHWPTLVQAQVIKQVLSFKNLVTIAPTGTGKTGAYGLPLHTLWQSIRTPLEPSRPWAVVLVPTRELALQVTRVLKGIFRDQEHLVSALVGGVGYAAQREALASGLAILVATPGRLEDLAQRNEVHFERLQFWVLDEMDRMLDFGFRHVVRRLVRRSPESSGARILMFSATEGDALKVIRELGVRNAEHISIIHDQCVPPTLSEAVYGVNQGKKIALAAAIIRAWHPRRTIVFLQRREDVEETAMRLRLEGLSVVSLHAEYSMTARRDAVDRFSSGKNSVLVATDIAGRGMDIRGVELVIHLDVPPTLEEYVHRSGRTARAGNPGRAIIIADKNDLRDVERLESRLGRRLARRRLAGFDYGRITPNLPKIKVSLTGRQIGGKNTVLFAKPVKLLNR